MTEIDKLKKQIKPILKKYRIKKAAIFGSYARGENNKKSDVDILVYRPFGMSLFGLVQLQNDLEDKIKRDVDVVTFESMYPALKAYVMKDVSYIL